MVNSPLLRPYFLWGWHWEGGPLKFSWSQVLKKMWDILIFAKNEPKDIMEVALVIRTFDVTNALLQAGFSTKGAVFCDDTIM